MCRGVCRVLEGMARELYEYWFVQFDFPDRQGRPYRASGGRMTWNPSLKRDIPQGWEVVSLIDYAEIKNGATPSTSDKANYDGDIVWITPKDLSEQQSKFVYQGKRNITQQGYDSCNTYLLPVDTILLSSRAPIGLVSIAKHELCTNQGFKSLIPHNIKDSLYLYYYIKHHISQIEQLGSGTTFKEVSKEELSRFPILAVKPSPMYDKWVSLMRELSDEQLALTKEIATLSRLRDELLPVLMSGQASLRP